MDAAHTGISAHDFECEACARELDLIYLASIEVDRRVAKALAVSEVAQIANLEYKTQRLLLSKWRNRANQASARAASMASNGASASSISKSVEVVMGKWETDVERAYKSSINDMYILAREAGWKKATKQTNRSLGYSSQMLDKLDAVEKAKKPKVALHPSFDLLDERAIADLQDDQMLWIGEHYGTNVRTTVRTVTTETMAAGLGRPEAGKLMHEKVASALKIFRAPEGYKGPDSRYFEGLAANTATNARARGQLRSFEDVGVSKYVLVNPMDHRTSEICIHMNGKIFYVEQGRKQIDSESGAKKPDDIKKAHPWLAIVELKAISPKPGYVSVKDSNKLADSGLALPPYHFRCRTTIDVSF